MAANVSSSTSGALPEVSAVPRHVAIIMDGNGRWARKRLMPRVAGHQRGVEAVRSVIRMARQKGISHLTLFAFSSENWRRPSDEVTFLMRLFKRALQREIERLDSNNIQFRVIGDLDRFDAELVDLIRAGEARTAHNDGLVLTVAANYGGRWDIMQAVRRMLAKRPELAAGDFSEEDLRAELQLTDAPEPDLFIRTGGERRISNFLLWQLAYTELYFTDTLWPDFDEAAFELALASYRQRERRFGRTSAQVFAAQGDESV